MNKKESQSISEKEKLNNFLQILNRIKKTPIKGYTPKYELAVCYNQLNDANKSKIKEITDDVIEAITNAELRSVLMTYARNQINSKI